LRVDSAGYGKKTATIKGYAAKFNTFSESLPIHDERGQQIGTFRECLLPGCFTEAIKTSDVRALVNHDANQILGRTISGTLRLMEDSVGLRFENDPPDTNFARDIQVSMGRGDISQCSFGFRVAKGGDTYRKDPETPNGYIREIRSVAKLFDVSVVTYPAYLDTNCDVAVRSIISNMKAEEEAVAKAAKALEQEETERQSYLKRKRLELAELSVIK
jgi:hypothetical protein